MLYLVQIRSDAGAWHTVAIRSTQERAERAASPWQRVSPDGVRVIYEERAARASMVQPQVLQ